MVPRAYLLAACLATLSFPALAGRSGDRSGGNSDRWNVVGPAWYATECGLTGFSVRHGLPVEDWRKPCSIPVRVCEFKTLTISYLADPDVPCEEQVKPIPEGGLQRTYIKRWD